MTGDAPTPGGVETATDTTVSTFCRICEARCGIDVTVRDGRVSRIGPDKLNPYSWKDFCSKGRSAGEVVYHPRRLLSPMRRVGRRIRAGIVGGRDCRHRRAIDNDP